MPTTTAINTQTNSASGALTGNKIMGKDDFLKMFVTQLKYQDPLNPIKNEAFAAQLAQFTQLEELQNMNSSLQQSIATNLNMSQGINNSLATTMIGKSVKTSGSEFSFKNGDESKDLNFNIASEAQKVTVKVYNSKGDLVKTFEQHNMPSGDNKITWDGKNESGSMAGDGKYSYTVEAKGVGDGNITANVFQKLQITGVKYVDGLANLLAGDLVIPYNQVLEVLL